jgi:hypothetical protein
MKRKRPDFVERRRHLVEQNLIAEPKGRLAGRRKGCLPFLPFVLLLAAALVPLGAGLR